MENYQKTIYEQFARIGKALSSPHRLEFLELLAQGERTVEDISRQASIPIANTSQHLQSLRIAGLVKTKKDGLYVRYRLSDPLVLEMLLALRKLAEGQLAEIDRITREYREHHPDIEPVDRETLRKRVISGEVLLLDVRPSDEFMAGHIQGAISVPLEELDNNLAEFPQEREIVAYCRGPYCVLAVNAVERLKSRGFNAVRMEDGIVEWQALGLPLEKTVNEDTASGQNTQFATIHKMG
jgi:rhodanese-related sulfurtransferase